MTLRNMDLKYEVSLQSKDICVEVLVILLRVRGGGLHDPLDAPDSVNTL